MKKNAVGEVDRPGYVLVNVPFIRNPRSIKVSVEQDLVWFKIVTGNQVKGTGAVMSQPKNQTVKFGKVYSFHLKEGQEHPEIGKPQRKKSMVQEFKNSLALELKESMSNFTARH